jgi:hypothetical protein
MSRKPIIITGSHRSGTTWVSSIMAQSTQVMPVEEVFNIAFRPKCTCGHRFNYWWQYVTSENENLHYHHIKHAYRLSFNYAGAISRISNIGVTVEFAKHLANHILGRVPLVKDPLAFFSAEWLAERFDMKVIIMIRHPAAFASSLKRVNWEVDFSSLLNQPLLIKDHLKPFEADIGDYHENRRDIIDQAILIWRIIHYVVAKYRANHPEWMFVRHEDLSKKPETGFRELFKYAGLHYSKKVQDAVQKLCYSDKPREYKEVHILKRDSAANIFSWKERLTPEEIERVKKGTGDIAPLFYSDNDW